MIVKIHRGQNQIGGSIIEVSTDYTRVILDVGINLDEGTMVEVPQIEGLFCGDSIYDAVFVSHYHSDHIGLLEYVLEEIPIYMGEQTFRIVSAANKYLGRNLNFRHIEFQDAQQIKIGDLSILPLKCDHSAYDSYMFLISDGAKKVLYSGDFRANGRKDYETLLEKLPTIDALIVEGTLLSRDTYDDNISEEQLEKIAVNALKRYTGPAFYMSSAMNVDRIITGYNIALESNRLFLEDLYTASIMEAIGREVPTPDAKSVKVFMTGGDKQYMLLQQYNDSKIGKRGISKEDILMCVRPSMRTYLEKLNDLLSFEGGILFYSMWKGYREKDDVKDFLHFMESRGVKIHVLHTSGHADINTITKLIKHTEPEVIIPVHTTNPQWFQRFKSRVILEETTIQV